MDTKDKIVEAIASQDVEGLADALKTAGVECSVESTAQPLALEVPGFGLVYYDEDSDPGNPGWVVRSTDLVDEAVDKDELVDDLVSLVDDVDTLQ